MAENKRILKQKIRTRNIIIRGALVLVFAVFILLVIENLVIPLMTNEYINVEYGEHVISNTALGLMISEESDVPLDLQVGQSIRQEYGETAVAVILRGAVLSGDNLDDSAEQICLTKLWIVEPLPIPEGSPGMTRSVGLTNFLTEVLAERELSVVFDDFCAGRDRIRMRSAEEETFLVGVLPFTTGLSPYYYPFDTRTLDLEIWVETEIEFEDGSKETHIVAPNVNAQYNLPNWQLDLFKEQAITEDQPHPFSRFQLTLYRSLASRLLTTTLITSLFVIIILLSFTHKIDAFIQASVAVLLTLLGVQDLLLPNTIVETTIVDQSMLSLYILFALAILIRLAIKPIWDHTQVSEPDEADDEAEVQRPDDDEEME